METDNVDRLARALGAAPSRRGLARLLATGALAAGGLAGIAAGDEPAAAAKEKKKCKPKCLGCQVCARGRCKNAKVGTPCAGGAGSCSGGICFVTLPGCGAGGPCRVFVTFLGASGLSFGGLGGADAFCQTSAAAAGLAGDYLAWLSAGGESPATRFANRAAAGPYQLVRNAADNGNPPPTVAASFADLIGCDGEAGACLRHPIDRFENGVVIEGSAAVWTGTRPDGTTGADTCGGWTFAGDAELVGILGTASETDGEWTEAFAVDCDTPASLYCFEQAAPQPA